MAFKAYLILFLSVLAVIIHNSYGCQMDGITNWNIPVTQQIYDIDRGEIFTRTTSSISGIQNVVFTPGLNRGPYLEVTHTESQFTIATNNVFPDYEEYETEAIISFTVNFNCVTGNLASLVFVVHITDTNNNYPHFRPNEVYDFTVATPLPPGFRITGCWDDIFNRDIDLTTQKVNYEIFHSPYFEIAYDDESPSVPKEFHAILRTTTFIRSIPEPIVFRISATDVDLTNDPSRTTYATVRITSEGEFELPDEPVFSQTFYLGTYTEDHQVVLQDTISLSQGYHEEVEFSLSEYTQYFTLVRGVNDVSIRVDTELTVELLRRHQLLLVIQAERSLTTPASATIVLQLPAGRVLSFAQNWYVGQIVEGIIRVPPLVLIGGDNLEVQLTPIGELASHFTLTREADNVIVTINNALPPDFVDENAFLILDIQASYPEAVMGVTTVILELVTEPIIHPVFDQAYFIGQYSNERGLIFEQPIRLAQGYDESVTFDLEGDDSLAFRLDRTGENSFTISVRDDMTPSVSDEHQLIFSVVATKPDSTPARSAIVITVTGVILNFEQTSYTGQIVDGELDLPALTVVSGYDLSFQMRAIGVLQQHFTLTREANNVVVNMNTALPLPPEIVDESSFIVLDIEVFYPDAVSGMTSVVLELVRDPIIHPVFDQAYYIGQYSNERGLIFGETIRLAQGYDESVTFDLEGYDSSAFRLDRTGENSFTISVRDNTTPNLNDGHQLVFSVIAIKPDTAPARAAVVITVTGVILNFEHASYTGQIVHGELDLPALTVVSGHDLSFQMRAIGVLQQHFTLTREANNVIVTMNTALPLPPEIVDESSFILLDIEVFYPDAVSGMTSVVLELVRDPIIHPVFDQTYYVGEYSKDGGLQFEHIIRLSQGFDSTVTFKLEGDSRGFDLETTGENSFTLSLDENELENIINRQKLVFSVVAEKPDSITARAAIVIALTDVPEPIVLSFSQASYVGRVVEGSMELPVAVTLASGYDLALQLNPLGEFASHFTLSRDYNRVLVSMGTLPPEIIENYAFISLDIEASYPEAMSGFTTIILDLVTEPDVPIVTPVFEQAYYIGKYLDGDLQFEQTIRLIQGFNEDVSFDLYGDNSRAFRLVETGQNSFTLLLNEDENVNLNGEHKLVFSVVATKPDSIPGQAAIVITLPGPIPDQVLGFERVNYQGSILDNTVNLDPIILSEGYAPGILFTLHGDLQEYFRANPVGSTVTLELLRPISEENIPSNRIILLSIEAFGEQTMSAFATIVLEVEEDDSTPSLPDPVFTEAFYVGTFSTNDGLVFDTPISLTEGYDPTVIFDLESDNSVWFDLVRSENSVRVIVRPDNPIPPAVIANNNQLLFIVTAQRPESDTARATVVILLNDEITSDRVLGFERVNYQGSIVDNTVNLDPIILSEGYAPGILFTLHGDLQEYFRANPVGSTVTLELLRPISEENIPSNRIILLSIEAFGEQTMSAFATIVLEAEEDDSTPSLPDPVFTEAFYVGTFSTNDGLVFDTPISLTEGYDPTVIFDLESDNSVWFDLVRSENSVRVIVRPDNPIPPAVIANNNQLLFIVTAQRPGSGTARATVAILLNDEITSDRVLGFERVNYQGSIVDNTVNLDPIILSEGYAPGILFTLHGDLQEYFRANPVGSTVTLELLRPISEENIPSNLIILLSIEAFGEQTMSAFATIVLEVEEDDSTPSLPDPVFTEAFYVGTFSTNDGLVFDTPISLTEGYDPTVIFDIESDNSVWFDLVRSENFVRVILRPDNPIPPAVIANNNQLLFIVTAQRPGSRTARATVAILLNDEITSDRVLGFERVNYQGSIVDNTVNLDPIILSEGYAPSILFTLHGDLQEYFRANPVGSTVTLELLRPISEENIPSNRIILLSIEAFGEQTMSAFATIVLEAEEDDSTPSLPDPVFTEAFYVGTFSTNDGLVFDTPISLTEGYDPTVIFDLESDNSVWFDLVRSENSVRVIVRPDNPIPPAVIANNNQLLFIVTAQRPGSGTARATLAILLNDEITSDRVLGFERVNYQGSIVDNTVNLDLIILSEGYVPGILFTLHGDLQEYFRANPVGSTVTLKLLRPISEENIPSNRIILLSIEAFGEQTMSAFATIVLEVEEDDSTPSLPDPVFTEAFYVGTFSTNVGLVFDTPISLTEGYDRTVIFDLESDNSVWFDLVRSENSVRVIVRPDNPIPPAVIANNNQLLFIVTAQRPGSGTARATVAILLNDEITLDRVLGFERVNYQGSIVDNTVNLDPIILSEGYAPGILFTLHGDLQEYFRANPVGSTVTLELLRPISEENIPSNRIILLSIEAFGEQTMSAFATIVLEVEEDDSTPSLPDPVFTEAFYVGTFSTNDGLVFDTPISLTEGYDPTVIFDIESDNSVWFDLVRSENFVRVILRPDNPIPPAVIANNNQLLFIVTAQRPGSRTARATVAILLNDEITSDRVLGFERVNYQGSIVDNTVNLDPIILSEGYAPGILFTLHGDLQEYFRANPVGSTVTLELLRPISEENIPSSRIILLSIEAFGEQTMSAFATIVLEVEEDDSTPSLPDPVFTEAFYVGTFSTNDGLVFDTPISLTEGYDPTVIFDLESDNSVWFDLVRSENSVRVIVRPDNPIPPAVIANNNQLLFIVTAQRPGSGTARATVVILLNDEITSDRGLGFERVNYQGSIVDNTVNLDPIILSEGYAPGILFTLHGDLQEYFRANPVGSTVTLELLRPISEENIPSNRIILLSIEAFGEQTMSAFATIVLEVEEDDSTPSLPDPVFTEAFYVGTFSTNDGLVFDTPISLTEGYDPTVIFDLESDNSVWFDLVRSENSVRVIVRPDNPIPPAVIANNNQLLFIVTAQRPGSGTARATVVILLNDEITSDRVLGFERVNYQGSIVDNTVNLDPIILSEGYAPGILFTLHGDLQEYFRANPVGSTVTLELLRPISEENIPSSRIILLSIEAFGEQTMSAFATIVLEVEEDDSTPSLPDPVFTEAFYVGIFSTNDGLVFDTPISLTEGYDPTVILDLESDNSVWFDLVRSENSVRVIVRPDNPIPPAVIANNNQLLFIVTAQRPGSGTARATVVILLNDEITSDRVLGFERVNYQGSIVDNTVNLDPIILSEGYAPGILFTLHGDLQEYFRANPVGSTVTLELLRPISEENIPSSRIILLSIEAFGEQTMSAFATIVLEVEEDDSTPSLPDPVFTEAFYVGTFSTNDGLVFDTPISLTEGYDPTVIFDLESDNSVWFDLVRSENSVRVIVRPDNPIPPAVIANNNQLLFIVTAQRPGSGTARATVVILLNDEITSDRVLGFERVNYQGSIVDNTVNLDPIILSEGYAPGILFTLHGDLQEYFRANPVGSTVTLELLRPISEENIPSNRIILLSIEAFGEQTMSAFATIVLEVEEDDSTPSLPDPVFTEAFYVGTFSTNDGLVFDTPISLTEGYDPTVIFDLESDNSVWFDLVRSENFVRVILRPDNPIPPAVIANNNQLLFIVTAQRPGSGTARATVVILLNDEITSDRVLGFERVNYQGSIVDNTVNLDPIILSEGYAPGILFTLHGDLQEYFRANPVGSTVTLELLRPISEENIPSNRIILLSIEAFGEQTMSAFATIVLEVEEDDSTPSLPDPVFTEAFYVGTFSTNDGLVFDTPISLTEGYDPTVIFDLESDNSVWFDLVRSENSVRVIVRPDNPIPPAVIANNNQLLFIVTAQRPGSGTARATVVILLNDEITSDRVLGFERVNYQGSIVDNTVNLDPIILSEGYSPGILFTLHGDLQEYFRANPVGSTVTLELLRPISEENIPSSRIILLSIEAFGEQTMSAFATIVLEAEEDDSTPSLPDPVFTEAFYVGTFSTNDGLVFDTPISLTEGYDPTVIFDLESDNSVWFDLVRSENSVRVIVRPDNPIPPAVIANNNQLLFIVTAQRPGSGTARATVVILLNDEITSDRVLGFERVNYQGSIVDNTVNLDPIILSEGYAPGILFTLHGDLQEYFRANPVGSTVTLELLRPISEENIPSSRIILLSIEAFGEQTMSAFATIVLEAEEDDSTPSLPDPVFTEAFYVGTFSTNDGLVFDTPISLTEGYDPTVIFDLESDNSVWFDLVRSENSVRVIVRPDNPIPPAVIANNNQLLFIVTAQRPGSGTARATVAILLNDEITSDRVLGFERVNYQGSIVDNTVNLDPIILREGYAPGILFTLHGDLQEYFRANPVGSTVTLELLRPISEENIPSNRIILLSIEAFGEQTMSAFATIVLEVEEDDSTPSLPDPVFTEAFYVGTFSTNDGLVFDTPISLTEGYDSTVIFDLESDNSVWFDLVRSENSVRVIVRPDNPIPPAVIANNNQLLFIVTAQRPDSGTARATVAILLSDEVSPPELPPALVSFDSESYVVRVEIGQTGVVGSVRATADNGESVTYSLLVDNEHLRRRLSINRVGDIRLSAPANSGIYDFQVVATTVFSDATGMATVHLSVEALTVCGGAPVLAPLIVIDRDEEEPLQNLVLLDPIEHAECQYTVTSRWPVDQPWLYVDETGLHATAIDREHPSIAFMTLSQVQVELSLVCDSDVTRIKRSIGNRLNWLGPYVYGTNTWLLGETILFNPRRSIVNLIVNDINDNVPIFVGKESEPLIVGYPVPELEQTIQTRSLAELQAIDADVGINAALLYWSAELELAVSPTTGFVHVRNEQQLEHDQILTVNATDLNGQGHTGSINLMVKLLDADNIAVVTVRDAFLEDENRILGNISNAVGYEVRSLRSVVISEAEGAQASRIKREAIVTEASLELYVYGLVQGEPVSVDILMTNMEEATFAAIDIARIQSLEDHIDGHLIVNSGRDTALLASTIVLAVLLFILIVAVIVWFIIRKRREIKQDYDQFNDDNSLMSQNESVGQTTKPIDATALAKPRLNMEELKKSERRLQDMLNAPVEEVTVEPNTSTVNTSIKTAPPVEPMPTIVIQDKLKDAIEDSDDDEFGEIKKIRKKSMVTFNENVEKIIHVDETPDSTEDKFEVYKL